VEVKGCLLLRLSFHFWGGGGDSKCLWDRGGIGVSALENNLKKIKKISKTRKKRMNGVKIVK